MEFMMDSIDGKSHGDIWQTISNTFRCRGDPYGNCLKHVETIPMVKPRFVARPPGRPSKFKSRKMWDHSSKLVSISFMEGTEGTPGYCWLPDLTASCSTLDNVNAQRTQHDAAQEQKRCFSLFFSSSQYVQIQRFRVALDSRSPG